MALPLWIANLTPTHACTGSIPPLEERVAQHVVAIGTVRELRLIGLPPTPPEADGAVEAGPGEWLVDVEEYLVGSGPTTIALFEPTTVVTSGPDGETQVGSASLCGWLDRKSVV